MSPLLELFRGSFGLNLPQVFCAALAIHIAYRRGLSAIVKALGIAGLALFAALAATALNSLSTGPALLLAAALVVPYYVLVAVVCLYGCAGDLSRRALTVSCAVVGLALLPLYALFFLRACALFGGGDCTL